MSEFTRAAHLCAEAVAGQISSSWMALLGRRLFYIVDGNRIESTEIGADQT